KTLGGLYGVAIGKMFAGESMYYLETDGSKLCLCFLVDYLQQRGVNWLDCQQMTPLLASFGAEEVERELFLAMVHEAVSEELKLF
ncbi:MAG TPA: leucyl/phenylalanyl-tRNA--protein transferase, partial [Oligoflexia bacterium]|nr:leucyl/phenylalanyl-tRNA--protein transferase [Oligoflexia bacterium]